MGKMYDVNELNPQKIIGETINISLKFKEKKLALKSKLLC